MGLSRCVARGLLLAVSAIGPLFAETATSEATENVLSRQLEFIRAAHRAGIADPNTLEMRCLQLVEDHNTPDERGMIYAMATFVYCERGLGHAEARNLRIAKTIEYAEKALEYPLNVLTSCRVYGYYCDALSVAGKNEQGDGQRQARRRAAIACAKGLKIALDSNAPSEMPAAPPAVTVNAFSPHGRTPERVALRLEKEEAARDEYRRLRELHLQRRALMERCVTLCSEGPQDIAELRTIVSEILASHAEVADELMQRVQTRIAIKEARSESRR